jgi:hypothetical protein
MNFEALMPLIIIIVCCFFLNAADKGGRDPF